MPLEVKLWRVACDQPEPVPRGKLDLEGRLEDWLCRDIGLLSDGLHGECRGEVVDGDRNGTSGRH